MNKYANAEFDVKRDLISSDQRPDEIVRRVASQNYLDTRLLMKDRKKLTKDL